MRIYLPESTRAIPPGAKINQDKKTVTYKGRGGEIVKAVLTAGGKMRVSQGTWHIGFRDHLDRAQDIAAFSIESQTRLLAGQIEKLIAYHGQPAPSELQEYCDRLPSRIVIALQAAGLIEKKSTPLAGPLDDLVAAFKESMQAKGRNEVHVRQTISDIHELFAACGFNHWDDIDRDKVDGFLRDLRGAPRHISYRRSNAYLVAVHSFANWAVDDRGWARESPLRTIKALDVRQDVRHARRALSMEEFKRLLRAAERGPERFHLDGRTRRLLYEFTFETGLRASEIARLLVKDFDFEHYRVIVQGVKASKNKRTRTQSLSPGLCRDLQDLFANKLPDTRAFNLIVKRGSMMIQQDLADAGIPYQDPTGACFDFHALRGQCASALIATGIDVKTAQGVLRHATANMTMDVYARAIDQNSASRAIAGLRTMYTDGPEQQSAVKTGTDDAPEIYGQLYPQDTSNRIRTDNIGQAAPDGGQKPALPTQNQESLQTRRLSLKAALSAPDAGRTFIHTQDKRATGFSLTFPPWIRGILRSQTRYF